MLRVLLIDDSADKINRYKRILQEYVDIPDWAVDVAESVTDAFRFLRKTQYELVILDLYLPLRKGTEPNPENAKVLLSELLESSDEYFMPYNIVGITRWKDADPQYKSFFDSLLLAYIIYEENSDDWVSRLKNKIDFLIKAQKCVQNQDYYDYDVAIINALQTENYHVKKAFGNEGWESIDIPADLSNNYYSKRVKTSHGRDIRMVTCYSLQMASVASASLTTKVIYNFRPKYLIMTGIAAGIDRTEVSLGDILVAQKVWDGASGKLKSDSNGNAVFSPDYRELITDSEVQALVARLKENRTLLNSIEESYDNVNAKPKTKLNVHLGPIVSVPAVLSNKDAVKEIEQHCRKLLGVEMEGYGVFYAAFHSAKPKPKYVMVIKSVSDYADPDKSDNYQDYCMYTSAQFAKHIILNELDFTK